MSLQNRFLIVFISVSFCSFGQGSWTWVWGPQSSTGASSAGQGVFAPSNFPEGRYAATCWTDPQGDFWRYGGAGADLWQYDPLINQWALMHGSLAAGANPVYGTQGIAAATNTPGEATFGNPGWVDSQGNLWLYSTGFSDDLWKYDTSTDMWTWMKGSGGISSAVSYGTQGVPSPTVSPGQCNETDCKWVDANDNLWLFNEFTGTMWKYDPLINQWTWMKGTPNGTPVYGTIGVASPANEPGQFSACPQVGALYSMWQDDNFDFWMIVNRFGSTLDAEIWKYSIGTNNWTCMRIDASSFGATQAYGTSCVESPSIFPIPRTEMRARWVDDCNNLWTYGGMTFCASGIDYGDLWRYNPQTNNWSWIKGTTTAQVLGVQGVSSTTNQPITGAGQSHWENERGFWLQGGQTTSGASTHHLWVYEPDSVIADYSFTTNCLTVNFTDLSTTGCNTIKSYSWDFDDPQSNGANTDSVANPTHTFTASGTYAVSLIVKNCTWDADTVVYNVVVDCGVQLAIAPDTICTGECTNLMAVATGGDVPYSFQWDNGISNNGPGPVLVCPATTTVYTVIVTDAMGLTDTSSVEVVVTPLITVDLGPDTLLCNDGLQLDAGHPGFMCTWQDASMGQFYDVTTTGMYSVVVDNGGCQASDTVNVTIQELTVDLGPDTLLCLGDSVSYTVNGSNSSVLWSTGHTGATETLSSAGILWVQLSNGVCSAADTVQVQFYAPVASFFTLDTLGCVPWQVQFTDESLSPYGAIDQWSWSFGDGNTSTVQHPIHSYQSAGTYSVELEIVDGNGCTDDTLQSFLISVAPLPLATFEYDPDDGIFSDLNIQFTDLSFDATSWLWDFGDGSYSTEQHPEHVFTQSGTYTVTLTVTNDFGCSATTSYTLIVHSPFSIYLPNAFTPDGDQYNNTFSAIGTGVDRFELNVFNRWGELIFESNDMQVGWDGTYQGQPVQDGVYTWALTVQSSEGINYQYTGHVALIR